jgi:hypothetical protein
MTQISRIAIAMTALLAAPFVDSSAAGQSIQRMTPHQVKQCYALKGRPAMISFLTEGCIRPYPDAGKACSDRRECEGECIYNGAQGPSLPLGTQGLKGVCEAETGHISCRFTLHEGALSREPCI